MGKWDNNCERKMCHVCLPKETCGCELDLSLYGYSVKQKYTEPTGDSC